MAASKYYMMLGVGTDASQDEIRRAYLLRAKMQHPDLYNPLTQPEEWRRANERLRELNEAYAALRTEAAERARSKPSSGPNWRPNSGSAQRDSAPPRQPPRPPPSALGPLKPGATFWDSMGAKLRERLKARQEGLASPQFRAQLKSIKLNVAVAGLAVAWLLCLAAISHGSMWSDDQGTAFIWISVGMGGLCAWQLTIILRQRVCELKDNIFVTPLYVIRTRRDQVRYYPVWELRDFTIKPRTRLGIYLGTAVQLNFASGGEKFTLWSRKRADQFRAALDFFQNKCREAKEARDVDYFSTENDFREAPLQENRVRRVEIHMLVACPLLCVAAFIGAPLGLQYYNESLYQRPNTVVVTAKVDPIPKNLYTGAPGNKGNNVDFDTDPPGATVEEDRVTLGKTPLHLIGQTAGHHRYILHYADWPTKTVDVDLGASHQPLVQYAWPHGSVRIETTPPGVHVVADGSNLGTTPLNLRYVNPGHVDYTLTLDGFAPADLTGEVEQGKSLSLNVKMVDLVHQGSIRLKLSEDKHQIVVTNRGDGEIKILKADLNDSDYKLKDTAIGPWTIPAGGNQAITFAQTRADLDFYSFTSEPKNLAIEIESDAPPAK